MGTIFVWLGHWLGVRPLGGVSGPSGGPAQKVYLPAFKKCFTAFWTGGPNFGVDPPDPPSRPLTPLPEPQPKQEGYQSAPL